MPIYEYRCDSCGHELDALQKLADEPLKDCPACDETSLRRLISAPAFRLKGDGWYETDFKSDKETKRNLVDGATSDSKSDAKSDEGKKADKGKESAAGDKPPKEQKKAKPSSEKSSSGSAAA